jgi:hypothetical protein
VTRLVIDARAVVLAAALATPLGAACAVDLQPLWDFSKLSGPKPIEAQVKAPLVAIVAEGDMVVLSFVREGPDPKDPTKKYTTTWFDMFRLEGGKIAEHWDGAQKQ